MKLSVLIIMMGITSSLVALECTNKYNKNGCDELSYEIGDTMHINQYKVIYDDDQDGVRNSLDKCLDTPLKTKVDKKGCHTIVTVKEKKKEETVIKALDHDEETVITLEVYFETAKYTIVPEYDEVIQKFANFLNTNDHYKAQVVGHTDSRGNYSNNMILSANRANAVMQKLIELDVETTRLSSDGMGPNEPIATNSTKNGRAKNRRIEVLLTKEDN